MTQKNLIDAVSDLDIDILDRYFTIKSTLAEKIVSPVLIILCTSVLYLIGSGITILPIWLFRDLCIPILHFCILHHYMKNSKIHKKRTVALIILLILAVVVADSIILDYFILNGRLALPHTVFRLIWTIFCGMMILGQAIILQFYRDNIKCKLIISAFGLITLSINALTTYFLSPIIATKFAIDGIELILMPLTAIILSAYSYLLGRIMTKRNIIVKLLLWLLGILSSEFITLWLLGVPRTLPTANLITTIIWLVVSAVCFMFCLFGVLKTSRERKENIPDQYFVIKQVLAEKIKPKKRTWLKWTAIAACFCIIAIFAVGYYNVVLRGASAPGPVSIQYESIAEMNEALGRETLYSDDIIENAFNISVSYTDDGTGNADISHPNQALIRASDGDITVFYYIIFNRDSVDKSYIGGYEEQNLRREISGVTVHYSKNFDGKYYESQAKFVYGSDLYVIDFMSKEDIHDIQNYIDKILG